jgi:hypothetical protein
MIGESALLKLVELKGFHGPRKQRQVVFFGPVDRRLDVLELRGDPTSRPSLSLRPRASQIFVRAIEPVDVPFRVAGTDRVVLIGEEAIARLGPSETPRTASATATTTESTTR